MTSGCLSTQLNCEQAGRMGGAAGEGSSGGVGGECAVSWTFLTQDACRCWPRSRPAMGVESHGPAEDVQGCQCSPTGKRGEERVAGEPQIEAGTLQTTGLCGQGGRDQHGVGSQAGGDQGTYRVPEVAWGMVHVNTARRQEGATVKGEALIAGPGGASEGWGPFLALPPTPTLSSTS